MYFQEFILWVNQPWAQSYMQRVVTAALSGGAKDGTQMPVSGGLVHYGSAAHRSVGLRTGRRSAEMGTSLKKTR